MLLRKEMEETLTEVSGSPELDTELWSRFLRCYVCSSWFKKPRILPCGHTFCTDCLSGLRNQAAEEWRSKYPLGHRRGECGYFSCPMPECHYTLKLMNLSRWSVRNKAVSDAVCVFRRKMVHKQRAQEWNTDEENGFLSGPSSSVSTGESRMSGDVMDGSSARPPPSLIERVLQKNFGVDGWRSLAVVCWMQMVGQIISI